MLRRALLWLLPAVLVLTFALPASNAAGAYGTTIEQRAESFAASLAGIAFLPSDRTSGFSPWSDLDDDDRVVHAGAVASWAPVTFSVPLRATSDVPRGTYSISVAFPRGPPSA
jgi:hypothetical protein